MTKEEFGIPFGIMAEYFGAQPTQGLTMLYYQAFENWPIDKFEYACKVIMETRVFNGLPKIAEIREAIEGRQDDRIMIAYQTLVEALRKYAFWDSVIFEDGAIAHAVEDMGGWMMVSEWTVEEWKFRRKEFEQLYQAHMKRGNNSPTKVIGHFEHDNAKKGYEGQTEPIFIQDKNKLLISEVRKLQ